MAEQHSENEELAEREEEEEEDLSPVPVEFPSDSVHVVVEFTAQGTLGVVLKRKDGVVRVDAIQEQAQDKDICIGDELWSVCDGQHEIPTHQLGHVQVEKERWDQIVGFMRGTRPLFLGLRRKRKDEKTTEEPALVSAPAAAVDEKQDAAANLASLEILAARLSFKPGDKATLQLGRASSPPPSGDSSSSSSSSPSSSSSSSSVASMLVRPGRHLVREGDVSVQVKGTLAALWNSSHKRTLFLFNDILIVASPAPASSVIESIVELRATKLYSHGQSFSGVASKGNAAFDIIHPGGTISIVAKTADDKECWVLTTFLAICELMPAGTSAAAGLGWKHQILLGTMHSAVMTRDLARAKELVAACTAGDLEYSAIEEMDHDGYAPLHYACMLRQWEMVRLLHSAGADVTLSERRGLTPIHLAALSLDEHSLSLLVANVFDTDLQDRDGRTPLYLACSDGQDVSGRPDPRLLRLCLTSLLALKADADGCLVHPRLPLLTPLPVHFLASAWLADPLAALLDGGASVNAVSEVTGGAALHAAAAALSLRPKRGLGSRLTSPSSALPEQEQEREALSAAGVVATFRVLLQRGARPNQRDLQGRTALQIMGAADGLSAWAKSGCSPSQRSEVLALLLSFGARLDDSPPCQAIKSACSEVCCEAVQDRWAAAPPARADLLGLQLNALAPAGSASAGGGGAEEGAGRSSGASSPTGGANGLGAGPACSLCGCGFTLFRRQHHCRVCNALCCDECSRRRAVLAGADAQPQRCCDACFNVVLYRLECIRPTQAPSSSVNLSDVVVPRPRSAGSSGSGSPSAPASAPSVKNSADAHAASRAELFSGSTAQPPTAAKGGLAGTTATLAEVGDRLRERGQKLERLSDKSADMANAANDFARLAKQLNEQSRSNGFW